MAYKTGTASYGSTGTKTITVGFQPVGLRITTGAAFGGPDGYFHYSTGRTDGTVQTCNWGFVDNSLRDSDNSSSKLVSVRENSGGSLVEVVNVSFNSFTATQFKINVNTADANYQLFWEAWG